MVVGNEDPPIAVKDKAGYSAGVHFKTPEGRVVQSKQGADKHFIYRTMRNQGDFTFAATHNGILNEGQSAASYVFQAFTAGESHLLRRIQPVLVNVTVPVLNF